jgi:4-hydroxy-3-methylbut-2-enyl diphosphate reductase IspH
MAIPQSFIQELLARVDVVEVVGGAHINNTRELANTCRRLCHRVDAIQT